MYGKLTLCAVALFAACKTHAVQLTPDEALARMNGKVSMSKGVTVNKESWQLAYSSSFKGNNTYYVFNNSKEGGYVILSADDCMPTVLGVVDKGSFDSEKIPANMKWWLSKYDRSISGQIARGKKYASSVTRTDIAPLLGSIAWGQDEPYNLQCPKHEKKQAVTGCIATAMAQIMRMYKWPQTGTGKTTLNTTLKWGYDPETYEIWHEDITLTKDFTQSTYDWDNMSEVYSRDEQTGKPLYSEQQANAVSQLMYDCGIASNMGYGVDEVGGSGATLGDALSGFIRHFNYDSSAKLEYHLYHTDEEWEKLIYDNLKEGMPVFYTASDTLFGGHAFVCDGYQADGNRYHINWGWEGMSNGYFLLIGTDDEIPLNPYDDIQMIEGDDTISYTVSFSAYEGIISGLKPAKKPYVEGEEIPCELGVYDTFQCGIYNNNTDMFVPKKEFIRGSDFFIFNNYGPVFMNLGNSTHRFEIAARFYNETDSYNVYGSKVYLSPSTGYTAFEFNTFDVLKNGTYKVVPIYRDLTAGDTEWKEILLTKNCIIPEVSIISTLPPLYLTEKLKITSDGKDASEGVESKKSGTTINVNARLKTLKSFGSYTITAKLYLVGDDETTLARTAEYTIPSKEADETVSVDIALKSKSLKVGKTYAVGVLMNSGIDLIPFTEWNMVEFKVIETPTGIEAVVINEDDSEKADAYYDLSGRRVQNLQKGQIYIDNNGKKTINQ